MSAFHYTEEDVSVIIVNHNGAETLDDAIESVMALKPPPGELVILDNGSTDQSGTIMARYAHDVPWIKPIMAGQNLGMAGGRNLAAQYAAGALLAFLDSDSVAEADWLREALRLINRDAKVGAVASVLLTADGQTVQAAGSFIDRNGHAQLRYHGDRLADRRQAVEGHDGEEVDYPIASGMVVRLRGIEAVWPLDETLLKGNDDVELGIRLRRLGFRVVLGSRARIRRRDDESHVRDLRRMTEEARLRLLVKYYPRTTLWRNLVLLWLRSLVGGHEARDMLRRLRAGGQELEEIRAEWSDPHALL